MWEALYLRGFLWLKKDLLHIPFLRRRFPRELCSYFRQDSRNIPHKPLKPTPSGSQYKTGLAISGILGYNI